MWSQRRFAVLVALISFALAAPPPSAAPDASDAPPTPLSRGAIDAAAADSPATEGAAKAAGSRARFESSTQGAGREGGVPLDAQSVPPSARTGAPELRGALGAAVAARGEGGHSPVSDTEQQHPLCTQATGERGARSGGRGERRVARLEAALPSNARLPEGAFKGVTAAEAAATRRRLRPWQRLSPLRPAPLLETLSV